MVPVRLSVCLALLFWCSPFMAFAQKMSALGVYEGYSTPEFPEVLRTSQYVPVQDGTKLAVDVFFPA